MNLFGKEKEFVLKLINGIMLIWVIIATVVIFSNIVNLLVKDPALTYDDYRVVNCTTEKTDSISYEGECHDRYQANIVNMRTQNYYYYRSIIIGLSNILSVGGVIVIINYNDFKPKNNKSTKK
ncbi:MAG: hypothetical protein RSB72_02850 [Bacilli bacterium]